MVEDHFIQIESLRDKIFRFAKKILNSHEDAQDIVQDTFEKLLKKKAELDSVENIEALTIKMTRNLCLDKLKHEKQKVQKLKVIGENITYNNENDGYERKNISDIIKSLINKLPDKQKMVIHLRDVEEYEYDVIAEIMDMDINAVRMNLSRGRKTIKEKLVKTMNYGL